MSSIGRSLRHDTRRTIVEACLTSPKTTYRLGKQLDRPPGSLEAVVANMVKDGLLKAVAQGKGTAYIATEPAREELDRLAKDATPPGALREGHRLLAIATTNVPALRDVLGDAATNPSVVWVARIDGAYRLLVAVAEDAPSALDELEAAFSAAGAQCAYGRIDRILTSDDLVRYARSLGSAARGGAARALQQ